MFICLKSALEIFWTVFLRWITYMTLTHKVMNVGNVVGHLLTGFAEHIYSLFLELKDNITVSRNIGGNLVPWTYKPPFRFTAIFITRNISIIPDVAVDGVQLR